MKYKHLSSIKSMPFAAYIGIILFCGFLSGCASETTEQFSEKTVETQNPAAETLIPATATQEPTATIEPTATQTPRPMVAFISNRSGADDSRKLHILDLDTGEVRFVETGFDAVVFPRWSPDGEKILFVVVDDWNIYTIRPDGSDVTQITDFRSNNPDWSPDGKRIVFQSDHAGEPENTPDIYTMSLDGEELVKIVEDQDVADYGPRWSETGSLITFLSMKSGHSEVYSINNDGNEPQKITESGSRIISQDVSPDGSRIAFTYPRSKATSDLYTLDVSGDPDTVLRLTNDDSFKDSPSWIPDGEKIIFYGNIGGTFDIWLINKDGSGALNLTNDEYYDAYPDYWSP